MLGGLWRCVWPLPPRGFAPVTRDRSSSLGLVAWTPVITAIDRQGAAAGSQAHLEEKVFRAGTGLPSHPDQALMDADEVVESAERDEVLGFVSTASTSEDDMVPLQGAAAAAAGDGAAPVIAIKDGFFLLGARFFHLRPGAPGMVAKDDQSGPGGTRGMAIPGGVVLDGGEFLGEKDGGVLREDPLQGRVLAVGVRRALENARRCRMGGQLAERLSRRSEFFVRGGRASRQGPGPVVEMGLMASPGDAVAEGADRKMSSGVDPAREVSAGNADAGELPQQCGLQGGDGAASVGESDGFAVPSLPGAIEHLENGGRWKSQLFAGEEIEARVEEKGVSAVVLEAQDLIFVADAEAAPAGQ